MLLAMEGSSPTIRGENNYRYYVWHAYRDTRQRGKLYCEGPAAISWGPSPINIRKMANRATAYMGSTNGQVYLIGWSRGAAACIQIAYDVLRGGRQIDAMFLFDAVDQDGSTSSDLNYIPGNVANCYHAVAIKKNWLDRKLFPTCGRNAGASVNYVEKTFDTSHGGIAGAGDEGDKGSREWMWGKMRDHGVI